MDEVAEKSAGNEDCVGERAVSVVYIIDKLTLGLVA